MNVPSSGFLSPPFLEAMFAARPRLKDFVFNNAKKGDLQSVIDTIDKFAWNDQWLMNIGDQKGLILDQAIQERKPKTILELGTFLGYSSLRMMRSMPSDGRIVSIEADPDSAKIAREIHQFAGTSSRITIIDGYTDEVFPKLRDLVNINEFDLIFIDHYKAVYLRDFKLLEEHDFIKSGTMIVADNVITPGAPDYLEYVRNNPRYNTRFHEAKIEYRDDIPDGIEVSTRI